MKISVLYHSLSGTTKRMAEAIREGIDSVDGVESGIFSIDNSDAEFIRESRCIILGSPVYYASMSGEIKIWFEKSARAYALQGKLGGAFATADYVHGGGEIALQNILSHMLVYGMLAYSGGGAYGKPVIHLGPVAIKENADRYIETFNTYGSRMAMKTLELFGKQ